MKYTWPYLFSLSRNKKRTVEKMLMSYNTKQLDIFSLNSNDSLSSFHFSHELLDFIDKMDSINLSSEDRTVSRVGSDRI